MELESRSNSYDASCPILADSSRNGTLTQEFSEFTDLFDSHRKRLKKIVTVGLDHRLQSRMDASDVIQETFIEAVERIDEFRNDQPVSLFVWLRFLAKQRLAILYRRHVLAQVRDVRREVLMQHDIDGNSASLASIVQLVAPLTTACTVLHKKEINDELHTALEKLDEKSREILKLRHFEQLSNLETAEVLRISTTAACNRYIRAIERLKRILGEHPLDVR